MKTLAVYRGEMGFKGPESESFQTLIGIWGTTYLLFVRSQWC